MDKNNLLGIVAIIAFFFVWAYFFVPKPSEQPKKPEQKNPAATTSTQDNIQPKIAQLDTTRKTINPTALDASNNELPDSLKKLKESEKYGIFAPLAEGKPQQITINTPLFNLNIDTKGGFINYCELKKHKTYEGKPFPIVLPPPINNTEIELISKGKGIKISELFFKTNQNELKITENETKTLSLKAELNPSQFIEHRYTFSGKDYKIDYDFIVIGLQEHITNSEFELKQSINLPKTEKSIEKMRGETTIYHKNNTDDDVDKVSISEDEVKEESGLKYLQWIAFKGQFFSNAIIAKNKIESANLKVIPTPNNPNTVKILEASIFLPYRHQPKDTTALTLYLGPNDVGLLSKLGVDMDKIIPMGWGPFRYISYFIRYIFNFLNQFISNYGIIIFILAILIKVVLHPLTYKSFLSQARMQVVNELPEMQELNEKYKDKPTELSQKKMTFYSKVGINPMGGCLPLLLQFPILIAMFQFFPHSIELRQQGFLWADDLSTYDSIYDFGFSIPFYGDHISLFTLLMTISTLLYTYIQQRMQGSATNTDPNMASLKYMGYIMPIIFLGILNSYAAALSYYYFVFNLLTIAQLFLMSKLVDKEKLRAKIHELKNQKGPAKKSRLGAWIEKQQKLQEEIQKERNKRKR